MAGDMVNGIIKEVVAKCVDGVSALSVCEFGDSRLLEETNKVFKKDKEMKKGIAFPTCVSVNNCICHFSPLKTDTELLLKNGDVVKIDLGAHIDGFIAVVAHTLVVGATPENKVDGRRADVIMAAHQAAEACLRLVKPGNDNNKVTESISKVAMAYDCKPVEGMLSHQLKQHVIDGEKAIIQNPTEAQRKKYEAKYSKEHEKCEFEMYDVFAVDVLVSSGEGKGREFDTRTTVYKKKDMVYQLKMKASRQFLSEVDKKFGLMPFTLRLSEDEKKAKMGVVECVKHELMQPFAVLYERDGEFVAQFKYTMVLMPNGPLKLTGMPFDSDLYLTDKTVEDEELKTLLAQSASRKAAKKKKKKAGKSMAENTAPGDD
ncbi:proliferation-associated protein 2G4-like isoform X2 [Ylistrum balloti]|uniref:proliferation-associated protein 2G4-like isoform X2 n=1 Tax=Ylistrum balloti TaxID=509963 RepID=UPI002905C4A3|nr:proliferation-associated protein 2G4-like isoform X2 [Ylistrum balloti]